MKTANELVQEYFAIPAIERVNTTLQDYVYDYHQAKLDEIKRIVRDIHHVPTMINEIKRVLK